VYKRAHLDLQIDPLAEREMMAVLQLLLDMARHLEVQETVTSDQVRELVKKTDVQRLTRKVEEVAGDEPQAGAMKARPDER
jgi:hypothetical protein